MLLSYLTRHIANRRECQRGHNHLHQQPQVTLVHTRNYRLNFLCTAMSVKRPKLMIERQSGKPHTTTERGLVPTSTYAKLDFEYNAYLDSLELRQSTPRGEAARHALALSGDHRFNRVLEDLGKPSSDKMCLAAIAKINNITLKQFKQFWSEAQTARTLVQAQEDGFEVMRRQGQQAVGQWTNCERCDGLGEIPVPDDLVTMAANRKDLGIRESKNKKGEVRHVRRCPICEGAGRTQKAPDPAAVSKVLEAAQVVGKKSGGGVSVNMNFSGMDAPSVFDKLHKVNFAVDLDTTQAIEAPDEPAEPEGA
jgi:hypothetical protein